MKDILLLTAALVLGGAVSGCSSSEGTSASFDVSIYPSKDLARTYGYYPSFEVDILGAGQEDVIKLSKYSPERYFESESPLRKYFSPVTYRFSDNNLRMKKFRSDSPEYRKLMGRSPEYLMVLVNLPLAEDQKKKDEDKKDDTGLDPRKFVYKIPTGFFDENPDLHLKIAGTGIIRTTREDAEEDLPEAPETEKQPKSVELRCVSEKKGGKLDCREIPPGSEPPDNH